MRLRLPPVFSRDPVSYAAAILQGKIDAWDQGMRDIPVLREAMARMFYRTPEPPHMPSYEANLRLLAKRLNVGTVQLTEAAKTLGTVRLYSTGHTVFNIFRERHPALYMAMQTELDEEPSLFCHSTLATRHDLTWTDAGREAFGRISDNQKAALAIVAAHFTGPQAHHLIAAQMVAGVHDAVKFAKNGDNSYSAQLRVPAYIPRTEQKPRVVLEEVEPWWKRCVSAILTPSYRPHLFTAAVTRRQYVWEDVERDNPCPYAFREAPVSEWTPKNSAELTTIH